MSRTVTDLPASRSRNLSRSDRSRSRGNVPFIGRSAIPGSGLAPARYLALVPQVWLNPRSPPLLLELLVESSRGSSKSPRFKTTTGGGFCSGRGGGGETTPAGPLRWRVVNTRRRGIDMTITTSSKLMRVTSTRLTAKISSPTCQEKTSTSSLSVLNDRTDPGKDLLSGSRNCRRHFLRQSWRWRRHPIDRCHCLHECISLVSGQDVSQSRQSARRVLGPASRFCCQFQSSAQKLSKHAESTFYWLTPALGVVISK